MACLWMASSSFPESRFRPATGTFCIGTTLPDMAGHPAIEVVNAIHERGGVAIPAHPYDRWRSGIRKDVLDTLDLHAIEVFNAAVTSRKFNADAHAYATSRGLSMTASSDAHHSSAVGVSSTAFDLEELQRGRAHRRS